MDLNEAMVGDLARLTSLLATIREEHARRGADRGEVLDLPAMPARDLN